MEDAERFRLLGKYRTPRFRYGRKVLCEVRGEVTIVGMTEAPIPRRSCGISPGRGRWRGLPLARQTTRRSQRQI
jgi:hypothetical protein